MLFRLAHHLLIDNTVVDDDDENNYDGLRYYSETSF
jgi:hypothetical protein